MAQQTTKATAANVRRILVDDTCIDCDLCVNTEPDFFTFWKRRRRYRLPFGNRKSGGDCAR